MPRRKRNRNRRSSRRSLQKSNASQNNVTRIRTIVVPVRVTQATSGTGGLTTVESGSSLSNSNTMILDPFILGGRAAILAAQYQKYRLVRGRVRYLPDVAPNGLVDIVSGPTTSPSYENRPFALGIFKDPALSSITYENILQTGGHFGSTARPFNLKVPSSGWLWTSTTSASPTTIDLRMTSFGNMKFAYFVASTTAIASYGHLVFDLVFDFQGAIDNAGLLGKVISRELAHPRSIYRGFDVDESTELKNLQDAAIAGHKPVVAGDDDFSDICEEKEEKKGGQHHRAAGALGSSESDYCNLNTRENLNPIKVLGSVTKEMSLGATPSLLEIIKLQTRIANLMEVIDGMKSSSGKGPC